MKVVHFRQESRWDCFGNRSQLGATTLDVCTQCLFHVRTLKQKENRMEGKKYKNLKRAYHVPLCNYTIKIQIDKCNCLVSINVTLLNQNILLRGWQHPRRIALDSKSLQILYKHRDIPSIFGHLEEISNNITSSMVLATQSHDNRNLYTY